MSFRPIRTDCNGAFLCLKSYIAGATHDEEGRCGAGGHPKNPVSEQKIKDLRQWREEHLRNQGIDLKILVDGGINSKTIKRVVKAGADICVAGTAIFRHKDGFSAALKELNDQ